MNVHNTSLPLGLTCAAALLLAACSGKGSNPDYKCIAPLDCGIAADSLTDGSVAAEFSAGDINGADRQITLEMFAEYIYDAGNIDSLQPGDTLIYEGRRMPVDSIAARGTTVVINGGIEQNGAELTANGNGTYRATAFDTHSVHKSIGTVTLPMADNIALVDCGENPDDPNDTINGRICEYLEKLPQWRTEFNALNTTVKVENGKVTEIHRRWIP